MAGAHPRFDAMGLPRAAGTRFAGMCPEPKAKDATTAVGVGRCVGRGGRRAQSRGMPGEPTASVTRTVGPGVVGSLLGPWKPTGAREGLGARFPGAPRDPCYGSCPRLHKQPGATGAGWGGGGWVCGGLWVWGPC